METTFQTLNEKDQANIRAYRVGDISAEELRTKTKEINYAFLELVGKQGIPNAGERPDEYQAAVTLALHLPPEELQRFRDTYSAEVASKDQAYIEDKVRVHDGRPQLYGTQFRRHADGSIEFLPIEDQENVDSRRAEVGLEPIEEYRRKAVNG